MRLTSIKPMENYLDKLKMELRSGLSNDYNQELTDQDREKFNQMMEQVQNLENKLLELKIDNNSVGAKLQKEVMKQLNLNPEMVGNFFVKTTEKNIEISVVDQVFGAILSQNENYEYNEEEQFERFEKYIHHFNERLDECILTKELEHFRGQIELECLDESYDEYGRTGISIQLVFKKSFVSTHNLENNVESLISGIRHFLHHLRHSVVR